MNKTPESGGRARERGDGGHEYRHLAPKFTELAELAEDDPRREAVRDQLVTGHLPLAEHIATRFAHRGVAREDLVQVGTVGLINAVDRFDPTRGIDFLSYAVPTIMGEVRRYFRDSAWSVRVPRRLKELHLTISAAGNELSQRLGRAPTPSEIAAHLGIPKDEVYEGLEAGQVYQSVSLDEALSSGEPDSDPLADTLGEDDAGLLGIEDHESLRPLIERLPERERRILMLRFFKNMTQTQIAERVGVSQMHVSRLLTKTLETLRTGLVDQAE
ncbi:SigB/SigF/SigG family RNA polymerase sigma factor [Actinokineospora sp. G85]|uniref:SigB/SigF/SigG family RNA polymerase sigma factor n=1 Tax=Actinokineospora sp. G85 TaxID=3406626 RepID=UPI003C764D16